MTTNQQGTATPPKVTELATEHVELPLTALIGIFGSASAPGALIRSSNGKFLRVTVGDEAAGGIVAAIGEAKVVIATRKGSKVLALPRS